MTKCSEIKKHIKLRKEIIQDSKDTIKQSEKIIRVAKRHIKINKTRLSDDEKLIKKNRCE